MRVKSLFKTKTFWLHLLANIVTYGGPAAGLFHVSPDAQAVTAIVGVAGIGVRLLTDRPASISGS